MASAGVGGVGAGVSGAVSVLKDGLPFGKRLWFELGWVVQQDRLDGAVRGQALVSAPQNRGESGSGPLGRIRGIRSMGRSCFRLDQPRNFEFVECGGLQRPPSRRRWRSCRGRPGFAAVTVAVPTELRDDDLRRGADRTVPKGLGIQTNVASVGRLGGLDLQGVLRQGENGSERGRSLKPRVLPAWGSHPTISDSAMSNSRDMGPESTPEWRKRGQTVNRTISFYAQRHLQNSKSRRTMPSLISRHSVNARVPGNMLVDADGRGSP